MTQYVYKLDKLPNPEYRTLADYIIWLNELGFQGWQLCGVMQPYFIFMRERTLHEREQKEGPIPMVKGKARPIEATTLGRDDFQSNR